MSSENAWMLGLLFISTMKVTAIGDVHGMNDWKKIVQKESDSDKFVFIGDYFDSFDISADEQIENFKEIRKFYHDNQDRVILLVGNHDFHYMGTTRDRCNGYEMFHAYMIKRLVNEPGILRASYAQDGVLYTHAGFSPMWAMMNDIPYGRSAEWFATAINDKYNNDPSAFVRVSNGKTLFGSPFWIRPSYLIDSLAEFPLVQPIKQVFGHTMTKAGVIRHSENLYCIDCIKREYVVVNNGEIEIKSRSTSDERTYGNND